MRRTIDACIVAHRYLGMFLGILMLMWCLSGIVMMYVPYPALDEHARLAALPSIDWSRCCKLPADFADQKLSSFELQMMADVPVLRAHLAAQRRPVIIDLRDGRIIEQIDDAQALKVAESYGKAQGYVGSANRFGQVQYDQWTVEGSLRAKAPLLLFNWPDARAPVLYISGRDGQPVQITERMQRFWNWLGSVPHWIYFVSLRQNPVAWTRVVVYSSLLGCVLTLMGLYIGCMQLLRMRASGRYSPYRGLNFWHHLPGLIFGIFVLSWVASGLFSMNPWGFLEDDGPYDEPAKLRGADMDGAQMAAVLRSLASSPAAAHAIAVKSAPLNGSLKLVLIDSTGSSTRIDAQGTTSPLSADELKFVSDALTMTAADSKPASPVLLQASDPYYFAHHRERPRFPVYRFISSSADANRFYVDPVSAELLRKVTPTTRSYRWLHEGMHRLDFIESRPLWDVVMLALMMGVSFVCATGALLSISSWRKSFSRNK